MFAMALRSVGRLYCVKMTVMVPGISGELVLSLVGSAGVPAPLALSCGAAPAEPGGCAGADAMASTLPSSAFGPPEGSTGCIPDP